MPQTPNTIPTHPNIRRARFLCFTAYLSLERLASLKKTRTPLKFLRIAKQPSAQQAKPRITRMRIESIRGRPFELSEGTEMVLYFPANGMTIIHRFVDGHEMERFEPGNPRTLRAGGQKPLWDTIHAFFSHPTTEQIALGIEGYLSVRIDGVAVRPLDHRVPPQ
ncbi:hypothetical protein [Streptomyces melanogenes]|uniref:hypothetical protein n=1 Tax=Streptomyces melanogenes TaxID=67326 RepID=UPI0037A67161